MDAENIQLRPLDIKDADGMFEWMIDPDIYRFFRFHVKDITMDNVKNFIKEANNDIKTGESFHFAIVNEKDEYLGTVSLKNIDNEVKSGEYAIALRKKAQGHKVGIIATKKILQIAFEKLELNRVYLNVLSDNERAIGTYEKCGFVYEGEFREHVNIRNTIKSLKWYSILRREYERN